LRAPARCRQPAGEKARARPSRSPPRAG
jgi:hypothetical protein